MAFRRNIPETCCFVVVALLVAQLLPLGAGAGSRKKWLTLDGNAPKVVARGGFSGLFPDSSEFAYKFVALTSVSDAVLWCDVQLTKDAVGICFPSLTLENSSNIGTIYSKTGAYSVNGASLSGFFTIDYTLEELQNVTLVQGIYSRAPNFDHNNLSIMQVGVVSQELQKTQGFWLNVQHDLFFSQHKLSMQSFLLGVMKSGIPIDYLSSPEVGFLRGIAPRLKQTKIVFRFLQEDNTEPTTNQTYGSLKNNLTFIKTFAAGILVPKSYIWPFDSSLYLQPHTSLVRDAHAAGLQVFAADFANDNVLSYNYSYNPVAEYLNFIDNGDFSVDGVLTDFPVTPSEAIDCFAHLGRNASGATTPLVISHNGASGDYPGCTNIAYTQSILDGADIIDCSVQMSKDGVPFCLSSINLIDSTTVAQTRFITLQEHVAELNMNGIFSFKLTWKEIQGLTPAIYNPYLMKYKLVRNPNYKYAGKLVSVDDFLAIANNSTTLSGVIIKIENAAYLAQKQGMSVTDAVTKALDKAGYSNQTTKRVMIQSTNSSVLETFGRKGYERVYEIEDTIRDAENSTIADIKSFADAVIVRKSSIFPATDYFTTGQTNIIDKFHAFNLSVFTQVFRNEFVSQDWDFYSDINFEMTSFVAAGIDGVITEFPQTAAAYRKNRCLKRGDNRPPYMLPVLAGSLLSVVSPDLMPSAEAPAEVLSDADVSEPPLPGVVPVAPPGSTPIAPSPKASDSDGHRAASALSYLAMAMIASTVLLLC